MAADVRSYLHDTVVELLKHWPENRMVNVVCHGHSVPAGYFATPTVDTFNSYPHLLHAGIKQRFPFAAVNVIVTAIGGENSLSGADRFERDVLTHQPAVVTIDYSLNDRASGLLKAEAAWRRMIKAALGRGVKVILLTPTPDTSGLADAFDPQWVALKEHVQQVRDLADEYKVGLVDSFDAFEHYVHQGGDLTDLLSWVNHPNRAGHELVASELLRWFAITPAAMAAKG